MKDVTITFTMEELQVVANGLVEIPFKQAAPLLQKIQNAVKEAQSAVATDSGAN